MRIISDQPARHIGCIMLTPISESERTQMYEGKLFQGVVAVSSPQIDFREHSPTVDFGEELNRECKTKLILNSRLYTRRNIRAVYFVGI